MKLIEFKKEDKSAYIEMALSFYTSGASLHEADPEVFERNFNYMLHHDDSFGWFIELDGYRAGYCLCSMMYSTEVGGLQLWIEELSVDPQYRGKGIGSKVLNTIILKFPEVRRFRLEVAPDNDDAKKLYHRLGYENLGYDQMIYDRKDAKLR